MQQENKMLKGSAVYAAPLNGKSQLPKAASKLTRKFEFRTLGRPDWSRARIDDVLGDFSEQTGAFFG